MDRTQIVLEVIAEVSGTDASKLENDTQLVGHLGIDSPRALELLVELEERLDFAERLLTRRKDAPELAPPLHGTPT